MEIVTGDRYLEKLVKFVEEHAGPLIEGSLVLKLNPAGLHYVQLRLEALHELESLLAGAPVDYLRAYVSDLGDHRALEQLRRILRLLTSLKVVSVLPSPLRDPTPLSLLPFGRVRVLELRGCDLSTSAARGLLELRHTLEKIICHNSTDALRHVFASRIAEIKDSPQWNRLSFVSCACNSLVRMDESLQLLPAVESLDLSRNKFAKVDNLRKCAKLKHLDLGFNHLRSVASFKEVSSHIIKLVLRNNALTTLRGIENLKSLEGLDVSYNIISNFSELEFLVGIPSLRSLWLEGNPLCSARWYRAHVFSLFSDPDMLKLDDKGISNREFWKRQIMIASRQKRPASFGFYCPAIDDAKGEGNVNRKKKKISRLASIESEEDSTYVCSDQDSISCDNETQSRGEAVVSDNESEIVEFLNRIEFMKKERSILWLQEFKEWMDHAPENVVDGLSRTTVHLAKENYLKNRKISKELGESSRYVSDSVQPSGDETSTIFLESDSSLMDISTGLMNAYRSFDLTSSLGNIRGVPPSHAKGSHPMIFTAPGGHEVVENVSILPFNAIDDGSESHSSSAFPGSPPHYRDDILQRRHNLVEEILQLSAESLSAVSSDSHTSCSEDDICEIGPTVPEVDPHLNKQYLDMNSEGFSSSNLCEQRLLTPLVKENGQCLSGLSSEQKSSRQNLRSLDQSSQLRGNDFPAVKDDYETDHSVNQDTGWWGKIDSKKKPKKRVISLLENNIVGRTATSQNSSGNLDVSRANMESGQGTDDFNENYFNINVADSGVQETCLKYLRCSCLVDPELMCTEREVVLLFSSESKFYVLLIGVTEDGSGSSGLSSLGCHRVEDVKEVLVGLGLQVVRVHIDGGPTYLFITRSIEKSRQLLCILQVAAASAPNDKRSSRSLEQVQVELFEKQFYGCPKVSIFQYAMVLFWHNKNNEKSWLPRSLFVVRGHVLVCIEDLTRFGSLSTEASSTPYFALDSCCSIADISEMVIEARGTKWVTVVLDCSKSDIFFSAEVDEKVADNKKAKRTEFHSSKWKLEWFSEEDLLKFVALVKALHAESATSPLLVRWI